MQNTAVRGPLLFFSDDPFRQSLADCCHYVADGLLVISEGKILEMGAYAQISSRYADLPLTHFPNQLIVPGFIDTHVHYPQTEMIAAYGEQLLTWLERYTFPTEQKFKDATYAYDVAERFLDELLRHGTTTALVFTSVYPQSTDAFFEAAQARNMRMIAGKVLMDRNAPEALLDTPETAYTDSKRLIQKWHKKDRLLYAVTPRFAITSTPEQLAVAGRLLEEFPDVYLHTHLSENEDEVAWTRSLFPNAPNYLDVYVQAGLLGDRSVFAHGIHLSDDELAKLNECKCAIAHCPTSNLFLGSGLFSLSRLKQLNSFCKIGLGSDIGAGTSFSMLATGGEAYKVAQLQQQTLTPFQMLFLATLGGAQALSLSNQLGSLEPGKEADFVVLDPQATPIMAFRNQPFLSVLRSPEEAAEEGRLTEKQIEDLRSLLFSLFMLGDDRAIHATYVNGALVQ
ncbi:MAG: guanine deaminase [Phormidesmis sp.]